jgi:nitrate reductase (NAD(P)H)
MQVLRGVLSDQEDSTTELFVLNCNRTHEDILMRSDLEHLMEEQGHTGRLKIHNTLTRPHEDWQHGRGRITADMMKAHLPQPSEDTLICICGPEAMQETAQKQLTELGFDVTKWVSHWHLPSRLTSMTGR